MSSKKSRAVLAALVLALSGVSVEACASPVPPPPMPPQQTPTTSHLKSADAAAPAPATPQALMAPSVTAEVPSAPAAPAMSAAPTASAVSAVSSAPADSGVPRDVLAAQKAVSQDKGGVFQNAPAPVPLTPAARRAKVLAREAAQVWARHNAPHHAVVTRRKPRKPRVTAKERRVLRVQKFESAYQGTVYDVPAGGYYVTIEATAPILNAILPPGSHLARGKFLPDANHQTLLLRSGKTEPYSRVLMLRFHKDAAWHPVELKLEFQGGLRTVYLLPKPLPLGKTIHVMAPKYTPKPLPIPRNISGNPYSRFLPAIRAVWAHADDIPGFSSVLPPRHGLNYGRLKLQPVAAWSSSDSEHWMILWRMVTVDEDVSNVSPAQFSGPEIQAVSITGTRVSPGKSPYLLTVEGAGHDR